MEYFFFGGDSRKAHLHLLGYSALYSKWELQCRGKLLNSGSLSGISFTLASIGEVLNNSQYFTFLIE